MKNKLSSYSLKLSILLALIVAGFFSINAYLQPIKVSAQDVPSSYEQLRVKSSRVKLDTKFKLKYGQTAFINSEKLGIKFLTVADSRCPANARCIRAGDVTIELEILKNGDTIDDLMLTSEVTNQDYLASADFDGYSIKLLSVDPYPGLAPKTKISDDVATLIVSKEAE
ncbi:MAG: hypothetical protein PUP93_34360 [Rhizonema sp. NSF051]|nr:hypothetical protein [Rhizonema sp. NSF051]